MPILRGVTINREPRGSTGTMSISKDETAYQRMEMDLSAREVAWSLAGSLSACKDCLFAVTWTMQSLSSYMGPANGAPSCQILGKSTSG